MTLIPKCTCWKSFVFFCLKVSMNGQKNCWLVSYSLLKIFQQSIFIWLILALSIFNRETRNIMQHLTYLEEEYKKSNWSATCKEHEQNFKTLKVRVDKQYFVHIK